MYAQYLSKVWANLKKLTEWDVKRIHWAENVQVDTLARIASTFPINEVVQLPIYLQTTSSITTTLICSASKIDISWMHEIETYLRTGELLEESKQAHKIRVQAACYTLIKESLYRRFFGGSYLKCLNDIEAQYVLAKLHEGICGNYIGGNYIGGHTLTHHAHSQGYYWPPWDKTLRTRSKGVKNAKSTLPYFVCLPKSSIQSQVLGHLHYGNGYSWLPIRHSSIEEVSACNHRLLQQIGGSRSLC